MHITASMLIKKLWPAPRFVRPAWLGRAGLTLIALGLCCLNDLPRRASLLPAQNSTHGQNLPAGIAPAWYQKVCQAIESEQYHIQSTDSGNRLSGAHHGPVQIAGSHRFPHPGFARDRNMRNNNIQGLVPSRTEWFAALAVGRGDGILEFSCGSHGYGECLVLHGQ